MSWLPARLARRTIFTRQLVRRSALNKETNKKVAIKKIPKAFNDLTDAKRILREIKLMRHFEHENVRHAKRSAEPLDARSHALCVGHRLLALTICKSPHRWSTSRMCTLCRS